MACGIRERKKVAKGRLWPIFVDGETFVVEFAFIFGHFFGIELFETFASTGLEFGVGFYELLLDLQLVALVHRADLELLMSFMPRRYPSQRIHPTFASPAYFLAYASVSTCFSSSYACPISHLPALSGRCCVQA